MDPKTQLDQYYLGFDIGGTKCSIVLGDKNYQVYEKIVFETLTERGPRKIIDEFIVHTRDLFHTYDQKKLAKIGISCGGPLDSEKGIIYSPPNLPGWDELPIVEIFQKEFSVDVEVQNDANACALAEWMMGAGSFEGFCSGGGIAQLAASIISEKLIAEETVDFCPSEDLIGSITAKTVFEAAISGDPVANEIVGTSATYLGKGLAILIDILNPECIVIGSIYTRNEGLQRFA